MLTPHCSAASGMVAPPSIAATTRLRRSSEYGFAIHAGLLPVGSLNHIRAGMGIPESAFPGNALGRQRRQNPCPAARALVEAGEVVFFVGRMDAVVVETEPDQQGIHAEQALEVGADRDRGAGPDQQRLLAP